MEMISACPYDCPDACSFVVHSAADGAVRIRGNPDHPFTAGKICAKGAAWIRRLQSKARITTPLIKRGSQFTALSMAEALALCAEKIQACRRQPTSMLHLHSHGYRGILANASTYFFASLGASTTYGSLCDDTGIAACMKDFGSLEMNDPQDLLNAAAIVNWGKDLSRCSLHTALLVKQARRQGIAVLTISPGSDDVSGHSDHHICIRPGTDRFLAAAAIKLALTKRNPAKSIQQAIGNFAAFAKLMDGIRLSDMRRACGVNMSEIELLADYYTARSPVASLVGWGLQRYRYGGENVRAIDALAMVTGQIGRNGGGVYYNISSGRNFKPWMEAPAAGQRKLRLSHLAQEIRSADPAIKLVWIDGFNPVSQVPDSHQVAQVLQAADFTVVVDAFMTDTAECADLILPCALALEHEEIIGSCLHPYVNYAAKVLDPPGQARSDFDIIADLGKRLAPAIDLPSSERCLAAGLDASAVTVSIAELKQRGFARSAHPAVAYVDNCFDHPDGRAHLIEALHPDPMTDPAYPLQLMTLICKRAIHSQMAPEDQSGLPIVTVSPHAPALAQIDTTQPVYLATRLGRMPVTVAHRSGLHPQAVVLRRGGWIKTGHGANRIIEPMTTDMGDGTAYYSQWARLET